MFDNFRSSGLLGFDGGYVAYGTTYPDGLPGAWFSPDGIDWSLTELVPPRSCLTDPEASIDRGAGATNGREVVLLGVGCDGDWFTWTSSDGRNWHESNLELDRNDAFEGRVLAGPGWWELVMSGAIVTVRRSSDGIAWQPAQETGFQSAACCPKVGVSPDGTRLMGDHLGLLVTSTDGTSWREVGIPFTPPLPGADNSTGKDWLQGIVAPRGPGSTAWVLFTTRHDDTGALTWTSFDLDAWEQGRFPMPEIGHMTRTRFGLMAIGLDPCSTQPCSVAAPRQFLSDDGLTWTALASSVNALHITDGPAGIIAVGRSPHATPDISVWVLRDRPEDQPPAAASPFTDAEAQLLFGLRADAQVSCVPKREGIPSGSVAAVECVLNDALVDRVFVYAFPTSREAARTYLERLAEAGVSPLTGNCGSGVPGDSSYHPGDDVYEAETGGTIEFGGHVLNLGRIGCLLDEFGMANVRVTCGGGVYIGVMGNSDDLAALTQWAGGHPGGIPLSIPNSPGICLGPR